MSYLSDTILGILDLSQLNEQVPKNINRCKGSIIYQNDWNCHDD